MLASDVVVYKCDHCEERRKVCRLAVLGEDHGRLPFLSMWICSGCLRKLASFVDAIGLKPAG